MNKSISLNSNYATFAHIRTAVNTNLPQGYIGDGNRVGVSISTIRENKKAYILHVLLYDLSV